MNATLTEPEAQVNGPKLDWKLPVLMLAVQILAIAVQWGVVSAKMEEHSKRLDRIEESLTKRDIESGQAYEFHADTVRRLESIERELRDQRRR